MIQSDSDSESDDDMALSLYDDWGEDGGIPPPPPPPGIGGLALKRDMAEMSKPPPPPPALDVAVAEVSLHRY